MAKVKTAELTGIALDWAVAKCEGALAPLGNVEIVGPHLQIVWYGDPQHADSGVYYSPSTDWAQGGPIIERERIQLSHPYNGTPEASLYRGGSVWIDAKADTVLSAAMLCYVSNQLGWEIEIPDELLETHS